MKNLKIIAMIVIMLTLASCSTMGTRNVSDGTLVDMAGKQRMLTQRIAKAYLFIGMGVGSDTAHQQLTNGIKEFNSTHLVLKKHIKNTEAQEMLAYLDVGMEELTSLVNAPYSKDNAAIVIDLSEALLEGSQQIVSIIKEENNTKISKVIDVSGRQRMLSQRIAKFYMAYQAGFHDHNIIEQLNAAVSKFDRSHMELVVCPSNTDEITKGLKKVGLLWGAVQDYYTNVEKASFPAIIFSTTDNIMGAMDKITNQYADIVAK